MIESWGKCASLATCLMVLIVGGGQKATASDIGREKIVLPGFESLVVNGTKILLGANREYAWEGGVLPGTISVKDEVYVGANKLFLTVNGERRELIPDVVNLVDASGHDVTVVAKGRVLGVDFEVRSYVEFDGLISIDIKIASESAVRIDGLEYHSVVNTNRWSRMLAFEASTIHRRKKQSYWGLASHKGKFLPVISLSDGGRSYWWFTDSTEGWPLTKNTGTLVEEVSGKTFITQSMINMPYDLKGEKTFFVNLLVGPVKTVIGNQRAHRVVRSDVKREGAIGGLHYWWLTAFIHQAYPHLYYTEDVRKQFPLEDILSYPGVGKNRELVERSASYGISKIPYFSAHVLNQLDPMFERNKKKWTALPLRQTKIADKPFVLKRKDTFLTHRAEGYTDYLLEQFSQAIDELGIEGLYFDQGGVLNTSNLENGGWLSTISGESRVQYATEILAYRDFHKRLATLFHTKGKKGLIITHNSNTMVLPAYSFVTAMLQGEEFIHYLTNYDYIGSISLDETRTRMGSSASGVPTIWLSEIWKSDHRLDRSTRPRKMSREVWFASSEYLMAFRNLLALSLLHDMPAQTFAPFSEREKIYGAIDWVFPEESIFTGYWDIDEPRKENIYWSYYKNIERMRMLVIVSNLGELDRTFDLTSIDTESILGLDCDAKILNKGLLAQTEIAIHGRDFELIQIVCDDA